MLACTDRALPGPIHSYDYKLVMSGGGGEREMSHQALPAAREVTSGNLNEAVIIRGISGALEARTC